MCLPINLEDDGYNMIHTHDDRAAFVLAGARSVLRCTVDSCGGAVLYLLPAAARLFSLSTLGPSSCSTLTIVQSLASTAPPADHAEKDSQGPQSDSPTSDAYAPAYDASFYTLRWAVSGRAVLGGRVPGCELLQLVQARGVRGLCCRDRRGRQPALRPPNAQLQMGSCKTPLPSQPAISNVQCSLRNVYRRDFITDFSRVEGIPVSL